ncbi:hypothetical protein BDQ12DRAFT_734878 [Crucibulum laeve]|uniref:Dbl homology domain-containing protein n=1 Tax=Crucibulum laeve TaxID=68775 RepID=A0A5C3M448_9AGAR|nr:hypothetical protein BDQ12DRAFT_734878 [Crucibulum laeve]
MALRSAPPSSVNFPVSDTGARPVQPVQHLRPPHLPFRRISLPTAPTLLHRESVVSVASFDSLPEDEVAESLALRMNKGQVDRLKSIEPPRRRHRKRDPSTKPGHEAREAKRRKIVDEFYETEKVYVDGLELIYSHFLTPIIESLETANPLLDRAILTSVFSNFIDIWNLHRAFFSSLTALLTQYSAEFASPSHEVTPPLSPIILAHFPYLSLYNPFVTSFPSTIAALTELITPPSAVRPNPNYNPAFAAFLQIQEADPRCGRLKLRDWLLTIVQRCPRYLLLLKDLVKSTDPEDQEHAQLSTAHTLVSKITLSLNTSLHAHAQTLALLSLQRATPNLPFQLIVPGRTLFKRGSLLHIERSDSPREREFLLFSDCLVWLAPEEAERGWNIPWGTSESSYSPSATSSELPKRPGMVRSRSKSEAELSALVIKVREGVVGSAPNTPKKPQRKSHHPPPSPSALKRQASASNSEERWVYKGRAELVDLEVVVTPAREEGEERRFEVLSPEGSFALYATTEQERDEWVSGIRQAKGQLLISLNVTQPNSTLTSSAATNHVRRTLQALPFPPSDERIATLRGSPSKAKLSKQQKKKGEEPALERRGKVEHWVPAIWIPDGKTEGCMRCGKPFGWRRRRHHCRLCGRCICAACSGKTFFIADPSKKEDSTKPARACDACYETVFPIVDPSRLSPTPERSMGADTITSLSNLPSWFSIPPGPEQRHSQPQALMAINSSREPSYDDEGASLADERERAGRVRRKSFQRPRSSYQIFGDGDDLDRGRDGFTLGDLESPLEEGDGEEEYEEELGYAPPPPRGWGGMSPSSSPRKKEDTARRSKRFSLPAVALHPTSVTARTTGREEEKDAGKARRFSLVLSGRSNLHHRHSGLGQSSQQDVGVEAASDSSHPEDSRSAGGSSMAVGKLSELLRRNSRLGE